MDGDGAPGPPSPRQPAQAVLPQRGGMPRPAAAAAPVDAARSAGQRGLSQQGSPPAARETRRRARAPARSLRGEGDGSVQRSWAWGLRGPAPASLERQLIKFWQPLLLTDGFCCATGDSLQQLSRARPASLRQRRHGNFRARATPWPETHTVAMGAANAVEAEETGSAPSSAQGPAREPPCCEVSTRRRGSAFSGPVRIRRRRWVCGRSLQGRAGVSG